jgi:CubicO group peptidase (beta-lactamase class C family)
MQHSERNVDTSHCALEEQFLKTCSLLKTPSAQMSLWSGGSDISTAFVKDGKQQPEADIPTMPAGCIAKAFTSFAILRLYEEQGISLDAAVNDVLAAHCGEMNLAVLSGITIRNLLNCTHGLDTMGRTPLPRCANGMLDLQGVADRCAETPRLFAPGEYFSLSDAGAMFAGMMVERLTGTLYGRYLAERVHPEIGIDFRLDPASAQVAHVCPTAGANLHITSADLAAMTRFLCIDKQANGDGSLFTKISAQRAPMPGFSGLALSTGLGFHEYGGGWFGHNAVNENGQTWCWRFHPERNICVAIGTTDLKASLLMPIMMRMLSRPGEKFTLPTPPQTFSVDAVSAGDREAMCGTYHTWALSATVKPAKHGLDLVIDNRNADVLRVVDSPITGWLTYADHHSFRVEDGVTDWLRTGQFIRRPGATQFDYLWNGRRLWRRCEGDEIGFARH